MRTWKVLVLRKIMRIMVSERWMLLYWQTWVVAKTLTMVARVPPVVLLVVCPWLMMIRATGQNENSSRMRCLLRTEAGKLKKNKRREWRGFRMMLRDIFEGG